KLRHRIQLFDLLDQVEQDSFLIVGFAEKSPINPIGELSPEFQAQSGRRDEQEQKRLATQDLGEGKLAVGDNRPDQPGYGERKDQAQDLRGKQMLQAAANDDVHIKDAVFEHRVTDGYGDGHGHKVTEHECEITDVA